MGFWDTLKFDLFNQGPVGSTIETEPGDAPVGDLPEGFYQSLFQDTNGPGTDWGAMAGTVAHAIAGLFKPGKEPPVTAMGRRTAYDPSKLSTGRSVNIPAAKLERRGDLTDVERRLQASQYKPYPIGAEQVYQQNYAKTSIGGGLKSEEERRVG